MINKNTAILALGLALFTSSMAVAGPTYTISAWPEGLKSIPCDAFEHIPGGWQQTGTIIIEPGHNTMIGNSFVGGAETQILDAHCGK